MEKIMKKLRLILGDQLNINHSWFDYPDDDCIYVMMEIKQETSYVLHHIQKILAIFSAMRAFSSLLEKKKFQVFYIKISDQENQHNFLDNLRAIIHQKKIDVLEFQDPDEHRLDLLLGQLKHSLNIPVERISTEHFLTSRDEVGLFFTDKKQWRMESFYRYMRIKHEVLIEGGSPIGGKWNYDASNRMRWDGKPPEPEDSRPKHNHKELLEEINSVNIEHFGEVNAENFRWPIDRKESFALLEQFIKNNLRYFGDFQDAMHSDSWRLFHSFLSFSLNTKMLAPLEVIKMVEDSYLEDSIPLNAVEGFIRQILGWREYIRGIYWAKMPEYSHLNYFNYDTDLPKWFWTGKTKMNCLASSITQSLTHSYAHHIQRLMVIGNFSLLAGIDPQKVHYWYLGIYIDAFEWVELPNTIGMSQYADGGLLATKPYVSSAAYINKMSNYCSSCSYNFKERIGSNACPFNSMYWNFFERHKDKLSKNPRLGIVNSQLKKMNAEDKDAITKQAKSYLDNLNEL